MTTFITTFGAAFMLGLVFSAAPGPIFRRIHPARPDWWF